MKKYLIYLNYILKHKRYAFIECCKYGLIWRGLMHDMSKLTWSEFKAYADYFDKTNEKKNERDFLYAWLGHIHKNPHHWQHWLLQNDEDGMMVLPMPEQYWKEMVADWKSAGKAITGKDNIKEWYDKNRDLIKLHPETKKIVEEEIFKSEENLNYNSTKLESE